MSTSAVSFVASLTDPATIRAELERTLVLQAEIRAKIPHVIHATTLQVTGKAPTRADMGVGAGAGAGAGAGSARSSRASEGAGGGSTDASLAPLVSSLASLATQTHDLVQDLSVTSAQAEQAIRRVRELDVTVTRAQTALERVEDILDLQQCLAGMLRCLENEDLLGAAATVKKFKAVERVIPVAEKDKKLMHDAEQRLLHTVAARFDAAVSAGDSSQVTTCCQLMSLLGNTQQGLQRYAAYVDQLLSDYVEEQKRRFKSEDGKAEAVNQLSMLFSKGSSLLKQAEALADMFMTDDAQAQVLLAVHTSVDSLAAAVMTGLVRHERITTALRNRDVCLREVDSVLHGTEEGPVTDLLPPHLADEEAPLETDALLKELAIVCQRCISYDRLVRGKAVHIDAVARQALETEQAMNHARKGRRRAASTSSHTEASATPVSERIDTIDRLRGRNQLAQGYSMLEEVYMSVTLMQIVNDDQVNDDLSGVFMSEDAFFILQKCGIRAIDTGSSDCACSVVNHVCGLLVRIVLGETKARATRIGKRAGDPVLTVRQENRFARLQEHITSTVTEMEAEVADAEAHIDPFVAESQQLMSPGAKKPATQTPRRDTQQLPRRRLAPDAAFASVSLNTLLACFKNTQRLRSNLQAEVDVVFTEDLPRAKLSSCLSELDAVITEFRTTLSTSLSRLCASLTPRLRGIMTPMEGSTPNIHYELTEEEFTHNETYDIFVQELLSGLIGIVSPFSMVLQDELYRRMVSKVAMYMAKQIEGVLRRRRFNQLGGLQLDRDVRALRTALVKTIGGSRIDVRDRLARLTEISRLLSLPSLEDVQLHWEGVAFSQDFPLTADEVKSFAALRTDWNDSEVSQLRLD